MEFPEELAAKYECLGELGRGGMGVVFRARQRQLDRPVAVKLLDSVVGEDPVIRSRFLEEGKLAAKVRSPNVVEVVDNGETADGLLYIVYELVEGEGLEAMLVRAGAPTVPRAVELAISVLRGLAAIHKAGILHRDIKAANVIVTPSGEVKILDFGIARETMSERRQTRTGEVVGTPEYLPPELIRGERPTPAADIYSVGVLLYALATGSLPFVGNTVTDVLRGHLSGTPPDPLAVRPELSIPLAELIGASLAKDPRKRPQSAEQFAEQLSSIPLTRLRRTRPERPVVRPPGSIDRTSRFGATSAVGITKGGATLASGIQARPQVAGGRTWVVAGAIGMCVVALITWKLLALFPALPGGQSGARVFIDEISPEPGCLRIGLRGEPASSLTTPVVVLSTPLVFPIDLSGKVAHLEPRAGRATAMITADDVAAVLLERIRHLPDQLARTFDQTQLGSFGRSLRQKSRREALQEIERRLSSARLLEPWRLLASHAGPVLASQLDLSRRQKIMDALYGLEAIRSRLRIWKLPAPDSLEALLPPGWRVLRAIDREPADRVPMLMKAAAFSKEGRLSRSENWQSFPKLTAATKIVPSIGIDGNPINVSGFVAHLPTRVKGIATVTGQLPKTALLIVTIRPPAETFESVSGGTGISVRINDRFTLRLDSITLAEGVQAGRERKVAHEFDASLLRSGDNEWLAELTSSTDVVSFIQAAEVEMAIGLSDPPGAPPSPASR